MVLPLNGPYFSILSVLFVVLVEHWNFKSNNVVSLAIKFSPPPRFFGFLFVVFVIIVFLFCLFEVFSNNQRLAQGVNIMSSLVFSETFLG